MSEQNAPLSENQVIAAIASLADELGIPPGTIAWISDGVGAVSARKPPTSRHSHAREVCSALLRDLNEFYTGKIEDGLRHMQLSCSEDIGRVVWGLVSKRVIQADSGDNASQFDGLFRLDDLDHFLASEGIKRRWISWAKCKHYVSWTCYALGTAIVVVSYAHLVSRKVAWIGWIIAMVGFALARFPDPKEQRF